MDLKEEVILLGKELDSIKQIQSDQYQILSEKYNILKEKQEDTFKNMGQNIDDQLKRIQSIEEQIKGYEQQIDTFQKQIQEISIKIDQIMNVLMNKNVQGEKELEEFIENQYKRFVQGWEEYKKLFDQKKKDKQN